MKGLRVPPLRVMTGPRAWLRAVWILPTNVIGYAIGITLSRGLGHRLQVPSAAGRVFAIRSPALQRIGAVTLGHAIIHGTRYFDGRRGRLILAHELAHTRQHDVLGPLYLPAHAVAQLISALLWLVRRRGPSPLHGWNPLEQRFIALGFDHLARIQAEDLYDDPEVAAVRSRLEPPFGPPG